MWNELILDKARGRDTGFLLQISLVVSVDEAPCLLILSGE